MKHEEVGVFGLWLKRRGRMSKLCGTEPVGKLTAGWSMKIFCFSIAFLVLLGSEAMAQSDDAAYCAKLGDYARRYLGDPGGNGGTRPDFDVIEAIDDCNKGNTAAGIAALEKKIRSKGFTPPAR